MLSLDDLLNKAKGQMQLFKGFRLQAKTQLTEALTICIPDMHLLEKRQTDDFCYGHPEYEERFLEFLDFLMALKQEHIDFEVIQVGDMYDLWQAKGNTNLIEAAYTNILGLIAELKPVYVVGNHDIDLVKWYETQKETFGRVWRYYTSINGKKTIIYEHGFQADFANNQSSWAGTIGREVTRIVGMMEYVNPDIDIILGSIWDGVSAAFNKYNVFTPVKDPEGFDLNEYQRYYLDLLEQYNEGKTLDHVGPDEMDLRMAVFGHTHNAKLVQMPQNGRIYYLMDCGSWVDGGHEIGIISGNEMAVCQWG
jgi:UDP-2,3-diacylglucosamine pyrophosphatase LpxH